MGWRPSDAIMRAVSEGAITPSEGAALATIVKSYTDAIDNGGCGQTVGCDRESTKGTRAMSQARIRQIARLQRLAQPYLKQKEQDDRKWQQTIRGAANHAAVLAFLIRYGKPRIDEPLSDACERCAQSAAWKDCWEEFKSLLLPGSEYLRVKSPGFCPKPRFIPQGE